MRMHVARTTRARRYSFDSENSRADRDTLQSASTSSDETKIDESDVILPPSKRAQRRRSNSAPAILTSFSHNVRSAISSMDIDQPEHGKEEIRNSNIWSSSSSETSDGGIIGQHVPIQAPSCLLCDRGLQDLDEVNALHHRMVCLRSKRPVSCLLCSRSFFRGDTGEWFDLGARIRHLHACQQGNDLTIYEQRAFLNLYRAWEGRDVLLGKAICPTKRERVISAPAATASEPATGERAVYKYRFKREVGFKVGGGRYSAGLSSLRNVCNA